MGLNIDDKNNTVLTTIYKRYDLTLYQLLEDYYNNELETGVYINVGLSDGLITVDFENDSFNTLTVDEISDVIQDISDGSLVVPSTYQELVNFLGENSTNFTEETITE